MRRSLHTAAHGVAYQHEDRIRPGFVLVAIAVVLLVVASFFLRMKKPEVVTTTPSAPQTEVATVQDLTTSPQVAEVDAITNNDGNISLRVGVTRGQFPASDARWDKQTNR